jgi:hypothetical protein
VGNRHQFCSLWHKLPLGIRVAAISIHYAFQNRYEEISTQIGLQPLAGLINHGSNVPREVFTQPDLDRTVDIVIERREHGRMLMQAWASAELEHTKLDSEIRLRAGEWRRKQRTQIVGASVEHPFLFLSLQNEIRHPLSILICIYFCSD